MYITVMRIGSRLHQTFMHTEHFVWHMQAKIVRQRLPSHVIRICRSWNLSRRGSETSDVDSVTASSGSASNVTSAPAAS